MTAPWIETDSTAVALAIAAVSGVAFGAALERAGLGSARKLVGQFVPCRTPSSADASDASGASGSLAAPVGPEPRRGFDLTVFKVLFTAIVVAMLGVFWLGWLGVLDLSRVAVPETWLAPQLVGGVVFGVGLAAAGLCPGTSCVAAASGRGDGLAVLLGMFGGVLATGLAFAPLRGLYEATPRGALTVPAWLGVSYGAVVVAVVGLALVGFRVAERIERQP